MNADLTEGETLIGKPDRTTTAEKLSTTFFTTKEMVLTFRRLLNQTKKRGPNGKERDFNLETKSCCFVASPIAVEARRPRWSQNIALQKRAAGDSEQTLKCVFLLKA
jgi:hypothetical protein